jgi:Fur family ferric uptake transcriptional regulator
MAGKTVLEKKSSRQILNRSRQRVTGQRALLLDLIRRNYGHLDADELYRKARQKYQRISLSTVYRNLQLFKKLGLINEHHFADEHHHYEAKPEFEHHHLLCLDCGKIIEIDLPLSQQFRSEIGKKHDFEITEFELQMKGLCSNCRRKKDKK